jgi:very-short-patch-repair endonuclease
MNTVDLIDAARELRKNATPAECRLWEYLRNRDLDGIKFRRQQPVAGFILDFYCKRARLGIELDGEIHNQMEQHELDQLRTEELNNYGILILRFWNHEVMGEIDRVLNEIDEIVKQRSHFKFRKNNK